jgi:cytochrome c-type biogenesis protein CcmH
MTLSAIEQEEVLRAALRDNPQDAEALTLLGRYLARTDRALEGVSLLERALRVEETARRWSELGQALVSLNDEVSIQARQAFRRAMALDPDMPEPAFLLGVAAYEDGDRAAAAQAWADILTRLDPENPFRQVIAARAADLLSRPRGGPQSDGAAPFAQAARDGVDMDGVIGSMVEALQARLDEDPDDLSGWLSLARARIMREEPDEARAALVRARDVFAAEPGKLEMIAAIERALTVQETDA